MAVLYIYLQVDAPLVRLLPTVDHQWVGPSTDPSTRSTASHPPFACAIAASKRSSCARRPSSRIAARTQTTAIVSDTPRIECTVASLAEGSSLVADKAMLVDGAVDDETVGPTSAENSLARALRSPNGRHQRSANAHDDSLAQRAQLRSRSHNGSARHHGSVTKIGNRRQ